MVRKCAPVIFGWLHSNFVISGPATTTVSVGLMLAGQFNPAGTVYIFGHRAATVEFWQARPYQWRPCQVRAAAAGAAFYSSKSRQDSALANLT